MKILVGIPTYDRRIDIDLARLLINLERQKNHEFDYLFPVSSHIARNRNMICHALLDGDYEAVLFLDSDIGIIDYGFIDWGKGEVWLHIVNELGQQVYEQRLPMYSGFQKITVTSFARGAYTVNVKQGNQLIASERFIKQ